MPTGYTAGIEKEGFTFNDFILGCAKAFGACITMKDSPSDEAIPEEFEASSWNQEELKKAEAERLKVIDMTDKEMFTASTEEYNGNLRRLHEAMKEQLEINEKYNAMKEQVRRWISPTPDHEGLKEFMLQQLRVSMGSTDYYEKEIKNLSMLDIKEWKMQKLKQIYRDIKYYKHENAKEIERVETRNKWIKDLRDSLK